MNRIRRFFEPIMDDKTELLKYCFRWSIAAVYSLVNILFLQKIIFLVENNMTDGMLGLICCFVVFNVLYVIVSIGLSGWSWARINVKIVNWLNTNYMNKFIGLDNLKIENIGTGKLISIISTGYRTWKTLLPDLIAQLLQTIFTLIFSLFIIKDIGWIYIIVFLLLLLIFYAIAIFFNNLSLKYRIKIKDLEVDYDRQLVKVIMSKFDILQNNRIDTEIDKLKELNNRTLKYDLPITKCLSVVIVVPDFLIFLCYLACMIFLLGNSVSYSAIISIFLVLTYLNKVLFNSVWFFKRFSKEFVTIQKLWDLFDNTPKISGLNKGNNFIHKNGDIKISNLKFSYGDKVIFDDFDLKIKGGKITAFVGESGGGKTTLMKLISGFIGTDYGTINIDGQSLRDINLISYYKNIGYLTQEPNVFDGTIYENLTYGIEKGFDSKDLDKIIKYSKCEFIYDFKDGLDTEIGERGVRLSGGQKQRLAIAKIFMKNPKIIFLDEPTSALDSKSEKLIQESFKNLFKGRTVVIIAHKLQTVKNADEIFVFENGKVIEFGTHQSLIKQKGHYEEMLELQSGF